MGYRSTRLPRRSCTRASRRSGRRSCSDRRTRPRIHSRWCRAGKSTRREIPCSPSMSSGEERRLESMSSWSGGRPKPTKLPSRKLSRSTTDNEVYSFHPGGSNVVFADGSFHFAKETVNPAVFFALITRAAARSRVQTSIERLIPDRVPPAARPGRIRTMRTDAAEHRWIRAYSPTKSVHLCFSSLG